MNKYKVVVYAICKNEEQFVERWFNSMNEADEIYVLDTGSTDNTVNELKKRNVNVKECVIDPWRFDVARNLSLELVPFDTDICVCTDLDEVFDSGWRKKLEEIWNSDIDRLRYNYNWSFYDNGKPAVNFYIEKIHKRNNYKWIHPVHEVLFFTGNEREKFLTTDEITVNHYPDSSKSRSSYLELLELSVKEEPNDDRNMHYLGREYMFNRRWNDAIDTLIKHLKLPTSTWKDERAASMRFIARSYKNLDRLDESRMWLDKAMKEAPYLRDAYIERALLEYEYDNYEEVEKYCFMALKILNHSKSYINETFSWDSTVYDLLSISLYYQGRYDEAYFYVNKAIEIASGDERLLNNRKLIESKLKSN